MAAPLRAAELTLDAVYAKEPLWGRMVDRVSWSPDGKRFLYIRRSQDPDEVLPLMLYDVASETSKVWLAAGAFGRGSETPDVFGWSPDGTRVALSADGALYVVDVSKPHPRRIAEDVDDAQWSPRGDAIAFSHAADLYVAPLAPQGAIRRLTHGGAPDDVLHATLDWVYPEELGIENAFRWSPDGKRLAYLTMDERHVTNFPIVDFLTPDNRVEHQRYPLAGQPNPKVTLRVVDVASGADSLVYDAARHDEYLAAFDWIRAFESTGSGDPRSTPTHDAGRCLAKRARQSIAALLPSLADVGRRAAVAVLDLRRTLGLAARPRADRRHLSACSRRVATENQRRLSRVRTLRRRRKRHCLFPGRISDPPRSRAARDRP